MDYMTSMNGTRSLLLQWNHHGRTMNMALVRNFSTAVDGILGPFTGASLDESSDSGSEKRRLKR